MVMSEMVMRSMLGDELTDALLAARERTGDATVMARCALGLWSLERDDAIVVADLTYPDLLARVEALA